MDKPIRVVQFGMGPIGLECVRTILLKEKTQRVKLVGAVDVDPNKVGRDVSELLGLDQPSGIVVADDAAAVLDASEPDVVLHTTASFLDRVKDQLTTCVRRGVHVVSSTEELAFPYERYPELSGELDALALEFDAVIIGTGVNPGYAMDTLALMATGVCTEVTEVHASRLVNAGKRRLPLQRKVGAGLTVARFEEERATGTFGHIGLRESLLFVARGLDWTVERIEERLEPVLADRDVETAHLHVRRGQVAGLRHEIIGYAGEEPILTLDLQMYVGARNPYDAVRVVGAPPVDLVVRGGIFGDTATVAALLNALPLVVQAQPGLKTMMDLPVPRAFGTRSALQQQAEAA